MKMSILFRSTTTYTDYRKSEHQNQTNRKVSIYILKGTTIPIQQRPTQDLYAHDGTYFSSRAHVCTFASVQMYPHEEKSRKLPLVALHQAFYSNFMHPYYVIVYFSHWPPSSRSVKLRQGRPHTSAKQRPGQCPQRRSRACGVNTKIGLPISKEQKNSI